MQKAQKGFTLIELVVVVVLLGILGVTALARFQDLSGDAQNAANQGVASELSSGSSINFATRSLNAANGSAISGNPQTCAAAATAVMSIVPSSYNFVDVGAPIDCSGGAGTTFSCLVDDGGAAATAVVLCIL